uniref:MULE transposase domain-containing protein n=1 Tax=Cajanus cajan TaxID=3821 RepID=A0A151TT57_CAJCA|nr:hypothetical protein KK1_009446 [Cajanus cajan]
MKNTVKQNKIRMHQSFKYKGTLLISTTQDGTNNVLPLAFVVFEGETLHAWSGICLIFDRHHNIKSTIDNEALGWRLPHAYHKYCIRHISSNFNHFQGSQTKKQLMKLGMKLLM